MRANAMRSGWWRLRAWWGRVPLRVRLGVAIGVIAVAGLVWQHDNHIDTANSRGRPTASAPVTTVGAAVTEAAPPGDGSLADPSVGQAELPTAVPDASVDTARATAERFATNFASPNGNFDDWLARISPDVSAQLAEQYRLTDIRNVTQATVQSMTGPLNQLPGTMAFQVAYSDGSRVEIRVEMGTEGWKVINVLPLNTAAPSPAVAAPAPAGGAQ